MGDVTRRRRDTRVRRVQVPWKRFIGSRCACDQRAPCLLHFDDSLDWQARTLTYALVGIVPPTGR